ncbi:MAG: RNA methyltransferase [Phycisphaerae bacterium]|nr:RNA methyltransferase [Phycisphaerae bacterium]
MRIEFVHVGSADDPRLIDYLGLRDAHLREQHLAESPSGLFMAEGETVIRHLLAHARPFRSMLVAANRVPALESLLRETRHDPPDSLPVYVVEPCVLERVTGFNLHRGLLASAYRPPRRTWRDLTGSDRPLVILEDLANHDNLGGIFRSVSAFNAAGVLLSPRCADPLYRKSVRVSVGAAATVPFARIEPWPRALGELRELGWNVLALATDGAIALSEWRTTMTSYNYLKTSRTAIVLGSEGPGLSAEARACSSETVQIPISPQSDSLNVVVAASIALWELAKPRPRAEQHSSPH